MHEDIAKKRLTFKYIYNNVEVSMQLIETKRDCYYTKTEAINNDQKSLFDITKRFLVTKQTANLPKYESNFKLANQLGNFFDSKIDALSIEL